MMHSATVPVMERLPQTSAIGNVLIVDEERAMREGCRDVAQAAGYNVLTAESGEQACKFLDTQDVEIVLLELKLPGLGGVELLRQIKARRPGAMLIVITGSGSVRSAVQAMKLGAYDYLTKPFGLGELRGVLERAADEVRSTVERRRQREQLRCRQGFGRIVGHSPEMERLYRIIGKAAQSSHPVLILGESGTGKELVAHSIHSSGPGRDKPFVPVDCGSLVPTLIESELFGYVKGAFTGAQRSKDGLLTIAEGGTVFLDEVGELPLDLQSKLLRAIQEREIRPIGSTKHVPIHVRILAATNRDLEAAVAEGTFRRDLYYRLNVLTLRIPPLRKRKQDIPLLTEQILDQLSRSMGVPFRLSDEAIKALQVYDWPGNVRELENCLERACTMSSGALLHTGDLPPEVQNALHQEARVAAPGPGILPLAEMERRAILGAIDQLNGDKLLAARLLGIGKTTLYRKLKEYSIQA